MSRGILVTGAAAGLGRAVARAFAERGERVAVHYNSNSADAEATLESLPGNGHVLVQGDITAEPQRIADTAEEALGGVDVLVNNAAVVTTTATAHPPAETTFEHWQQVWRDSVAVNLLGAADVTFCVARHMIERGARGHIVNVGSRGAFRGEPDHPAYGATKAALHAMGQSLAVSLAPHGISVASVAPGFIATERVADWLTGERGDALRAQSPFGRVAEPGEIADAIVYLAAPGSTWASGAILDLNGASYLRT
ncbi:NAD(P)-dependent dehydrogenase (short-subunit alcohol dehydrogenase family) [Amycolatopsis bartoniae]|uniref:Epimerase n=1 Tax=Amycolatopsis bartoniae TaxID=941986 RepID=A0A8H9MCD1_9PSEU|nr:SDR family oxidoreductase [Amycolatopsis bartoniae]MBB2935808.1 NAD(P)-dependent dehydrogenase (short-subunit alcohol dehydrogenase family) [Amycolatopsis bartoniae]TVT00273.1 SDR family oxidoreductase [Amycolatopsis bartoniae]GHF61998.1 epimerase [Amycolatopsis bartoniae]